MSRPSRSFFSYSGGTQCAICLLALWFLLNIFDILTTFQALSTGRAVELNPIMAFLMTMPSLAIVVKMLGAYAAARVIEKMEARNSYCAILTLLVMDAYVALVCVNNLRVCFST